jgi:hypothetical protein
MYKRFLFSMCILSSLISKAGVITLEGTYQGKNIYVTNPFASGGVGFCISEVLVNEKPTLDEINSSSFEIDLSVLKLSIGEKVVIKLNHKDDCKPRIVNPEDLKVKSTFEIVAGSAKVNKDGTFSWTTKGETGKLPFTVEQYRWNKWVKVDEVEGKGRLEGAFYSIKYQAHSGENKIRIKQVDVSGPRYSPEVKYRSTSPEVKIKNDKVDKLLEFTDDTKYEVFDMFGTVILKGYGSDVETENLKKGQYYINFDNKTGTKFTRK